MKQQPRRINGKINSPTRQMIPTTIQAAVPIEWSVAVMMSAIQ
jgi:hypothetical protein